MSSATPKLIKELREKSGAGMLDCKKALVRCDGNIDEAIKFLREAGLSKAAKKSSNVAAEGVVSILVNDTNSKVSMVPDIFSPIKSISGVVKSRGFLANRIPLSNPIAIAAWNGSCTLIIESS